MSPVELIARPAAPAAPHSWDASDETFFRLVCAVFPPDHLLGATVLLASYDES